MFRTNKCPSSGGGLYKQLIVFQHVEIILQVFELSMYTSSL